MQPEPGIKPGHKSSFRDLYRGQQSSNQSFLECYHLFGSDIGSTQVCTRDPEVDAVAAKLVDAPSFSVHLTKFVKQEVETNTLHKAKTKKRFLKLAKAVEEKKIKVEGGIPKLRIDTARSPKPPRDMSSDKVANQKFYSTAVSSNECDTGRQYILYQERGRRHYPYSPASQLSHLSHAQARQLSVQSQSSGTSERKIPERC